MEWTITKLNTLKKQGKSPDDPDNYRGIAVLNTVAKIYSRIIEIKASNAIDLPTTQAAQKYHSVADAGLALRVLQEKYASYWNLMIQPTFEENEMTNDFINNNMNTPINVKALHNENQYMGEGLLFVCFIDIKKRSLA